jgi:hypothetical protein
LRRGFGADQSLAAETTLSTRDWLSALEGHAGAAKTTIVGAIRELEHERGYLVRGFGPTSGSVKALTAAGVLARTVANLLENPKLEKRCGEVWIVDESSLLATRQVIEHFISPSRSASNASFSSGTSASITRSKRAARFTRCGWRE